MVQTLPITIQTMYADLIERCATAAFDADFPADGSFVRVRVKDRAYWYFQAGARGESGWQQRKYVGPDTPELVARIAQHGAVKKDYRQRRSMIAALQRAGLPVPDPLTGKLLRALSAAGIFRLRACLVGTVAYQTFAGLLGVRLPGAIVQTGDLDLAQFQPVSVAVAADERAALGEILAATDPSFRAVPHIADPRRSTSFVNSDGYRVDLLVPNRGPESGRPRALPALGAHGEPLRFLDYLIRDAVPAAVLHEGGVPVNVPRPERYAVHKLIVARRRRAGTAKIDKDLRQAELLLDVLAERRKADLREVWREAVGRGPKWRAAIMQSIEQLAPATREKVADAVKARL